MIGYVLDIMICKFNIKNILFYFKNMRMVTFFFLRSNHNNTQICVG